MYSVPHILEISVTELCDHKIHDMDPKITLKEIMD
jgi:hypothetical protein